MTPSDRDRDRSSSGPDAPLPALADRAYAFLVAAGGEGGAAELAAHVFGASGAGPWRPILDAVLARDARFRAFQAGWQLADSGTVVGAGPGRTVVGIALATTGQDPSRHRVVRVAAVRIADGAVTGRFDAAVNPRRRLPRYLSTATGLTQETADEAPSFAEVAEPLRELIGDAPLVAYRVGWLLEFLAAEFSRAELPRLANPSIELDELVRGLLVERRKPTLQSLAEQLGLSHPRPNYPPADAEVAARAGLALLAMAEERGTGALAARIPSRGGAWPLIPRGWLATVPSSPGVYTIEDDRGAVLYVGKAIDLRRRLAAYLGRPLGLDRQLEALATRAARITTQPAATDVEARLLEARLIRRHRPPFNVQRRTRPRSLFLRAGANDPIPRLHLSRQAAADGAVYLGPFRSERAARASLTLVRAVYPGACLRRADNVAEQRAAVQAAVRLLTGHKADALTTLRARMRAASAQGDYVAAERARALIRAVLDFAVHASPLLGRSLAQPMLVLEPDGPDGARRAHLVTLGHLVASHTVEADFDPTDPHLVRQLAEMLRAQAAPIDDEEDAEIVLRWLCELGPECTIASFDRPREDQ